MGKDYIEEIKFVKNKINYTFKTEPNTLNNNQMWWIEPEVTMYAGTKADAKKVAELIRKNEKLIK